MAGDPVEAPESASASIPSEERLKLWVRSGGRCAFCNAYLLEDATTGFAFNLGEAAHNVGRSRGARSPRGADPLPVNQRNLAENLLLLCRVHHRLIDSPAGQAEYPVERLREIKRIHEERIAELTSLGDDAGTAILRVVGEVRGAAVSVSSEAVRQAVRAAGRFPRFEGGVGPGADLEVDLRGEPDEGGSAYWDNVRRRLEVEFERIAYGVEREQIKHLSVFALARIPVLVMLGHLLDDKLPTDIYQLQRDGRGWAWGDDPEPPVSFDVVEHELVVGDRLTLLLSLSGSIQRDSLPAEISDGASLYELGPIDRTPAPSIIGSPASLADFTGTYRTFLARLERDHPQVSCIDVVPAVPLSAAIEVGRARMREVHPTLRLWEWTGETYAQSVEIGP